MSVREESDETSYETNACTAKDNDHFIKNCKLLSAVQSCVINVVAAETVKKHRRREELRKKSSV
jgi:hypothetical protein